MNSRFFPLKQQILFVILKASKKFTKVGRNEIKPCSLASHPGMRFPVENEPFFEVFLARSKLTHAFHFIFNT